MEKASKHLEDISEIRQIMERSSKFLSLSGWSGIFAGFFAILGALAAYIYLGTAEYYNAESYRDAANEGVINPTTFLLLDAAFVLLLAMLFGLLFSYRKAKKTGEKFWSPVLKRLLMALFIPLVTGGILSVILIWQDQLVLVAPLTLIFYGTALTASSRYVNKELLMLGLLEIALGEAAIIWPQLGLWFWAGGFGLLHVLYGTIVYFKYDRK